jgi:hypothetical protein
MSPKSRPAAPRDWVRESPGTYRSADGRFTLEGDGAGRWFVRDEEQIDELGLPRTTGPHPTLAAAKEAAAEQRSRGPEASPLADQLAGRSVAPKGVPAKAAPAERAATTPAATKRATAERPAAQRGARPPKPSPSKAEPPARAATWVDTLAKTDRDAARRARELISDLQLLDVEDAADLVRQDVLGVQPEVARRLLIEAMRRALATELAPTRLIEAAKRSGVRSGVQASDDQRLAVAVAARAMEVALDVLVNQGRLDGAPGRLPGWELVETGSRRRRIRLTVGDLGSRDRGGR